MPNRCAFLLLGACSRPWRGAPPHLGQHWAPSRLPRTRPRAPETSAGHGLCSWAQGRGGMGGKQRRGLYRLRCAVPGNQRKPWCRAFVVTRRASLRGRRVPAASGAGLGGTKFEKRGSTVVRKRGPEVRVSVLGQPPAPSRRTAP